MRMIKVMRKKKTFFVSRDVFFPLGCTLVHHVVTHSMSLNLYNLTLLKSGLTSSAIIGHFTGTNEQEVLIARGKTLEILRVNTLLNKLETVISVDVFSTIRSLASFRATGKVDASIFKLYYLHFRLGNDRDYIVIGSDSGKLVVLAYNEQTHHLDVIVSESVGKPGCRRTVPGQYVATDPKGKSIMISALEGKSLVYSFHQTKSKNSINGPLEIDSPNHLIFDIIGVESSSKKPSFASLSCDYDGLVNDGQMQGNGKMVNFYRIDWDRNEASSKESLPVDRTAYKIVSIPSIYGFGSLLVLAKDKIYYKSVETDLEAEVAIPRRLNTVAMSYQGESDLGVYMISCQFVEKEEESFFLLHSEYGDIFKLSLVLEEGKVQALDIKYYDTTPPSTALCVLDNKYIYAASETGNHFLYSLVGFECINEVSEERDGVVYINPQPLKQLTMVDEIKSACPVLDMKVDNVIRDDTSQQLVLLTGSGPRSTLRILVHGIDVDVVVNQVIRENPTHVWTLKQSANHTEDGYIVIAYPDVTVILSVGENVEPISESDPLASTFVTDQQTLNIGLFGNGYIQVLSQSIRYIKGTKPQEWSPPDGLSISHSDINEKQVVISLSNGDVYYFELDGARFKEIASLPSEGKAIHAIAIHPIVDDQKGIYVAIADNDSKLYLHSLDGSEPLELKSTQQLPAKSSSLAFLSSNTIGYNYIVSGSINGILTRMRIDDDGNVGEAHNKYLGSRAISMNPVLIQGNPGILCTSRKTWVLFGERSTLKLVPLSCGQLEHAASFHSAQNPNSIVAISKENVKIFSLTRIGEPFTHIEMPLRYTPRKSTIIPNTKIMILAESDHNALSRVQIDNMEVERKEGSMELEDPSPLQKVPPSLSGVPKPGPGRWASCVRVVDLFQLETLDLVELEENQAAVSICHISFRDHGNDIFVCVGVAKDLVVYPNRRCKEGYVYVCRFVEEGRKLEFMSSMRVDGIPTALAAYQGRLLVGLGSSLMIYDLSKINNTLVKKCENSAFPSVIVTISTFGERIIVGDIQESFHYVKYNRPDNSLTIIVDDVIPRWITSAETLDYSTVAGSDKFGNIFILRVPDKVAHFENDLSSSRFSWESGHKTGAPYKLDSICSFYTGETVTNVKKVQLTQGCAEVLIYTTITGTVGALIPLSTRADVEFFARLELLLRQECPPLCGRDHLAYRSSFFPLKNVIDGDLCEMYATLDQDKQRYIAEDLELTPFELQRKIEEIRENV